MATSSLAYEMPPDVDAVPALLDRLEAFADEAGLSPRAAQHLALVAEELAANVAMHGKGATFIRLAAVRDGTDLHLTLEDDGPPFDPLSAKAPDLEADVETRDIGGLGVHFIRVLTRGATYERRGALNRLTAVLDAG
ncbi:ATP-binding protein [Muricoccus radiodurans]|uniref:ATP-binding protein n=1 Tax=Muricoccus radiodurans TaxID=2231721 RepID=UPI003CEC8CA0